MRRPEARAGSNGLDSAWRNLNLASRLLHRCADACVLLVCSFADVPSLEWFFVGLSMFVGLSFGASFLPELARPTFGPRENRRLASVKSLTFKEVLELVRPDLLRVEEEFGLQTTTGVRTITEIGQYLQEGGGKRLRPALVLLASRLCGYEGMAAVRLGAVVEMIHTATLVHDDVIDQADTRRGRPSTNSRWGNTMSVLAGDWLYMQAFNVALAERNFRILDVLIRLTQVMVEGELLQLTSLRKATVSEEGYLELAYRKTACLFSACLRLGALLGGNNEVQEMQLGSYGINLGMAFQLIDDMLDFTSSEEILGKPIGNDMREGKMTLPLIYLLQRCSPGEARKVSLMLEEEGFQPGQFGEILDLIEHYGALQAAREKAQDFSDKARTFLEGFPDSAYKDALHSLPDFILEREF
jgi:octaprenyl-diphosphate synthase